MVEDVELMDKNLQNAKRSMSLRIPTATTVAFDKYRKNSRCCRPIVVKRKVAEKRE
jgi:hypothetical protein